MRIAAQLGIDSIATEELTRASNVAVKLAPRGAVNTAQQLMSRAAAVSTTP